jgi:proteasome accessory factor C
VRLHPAARWVAEYYLARDIIECADGALEVTLPTGTMQWLARLFLRLGRDADVLEPAGLRDEIVAQARETLALYDPRPA